jgi:antitoxin (DNA-binding transcriptional repressor) of toxin-antitoxin stability system
MTGKVISIEKAETQLLLLIKATLEGEEVVITENEVPIIKLVLINPIWPRRGAINPEQLNILISDE